MEQEEGSCGARRSRQLRDGAKEAKEEKQQKGSSYYGAALSGTAVLVLFATGGLVSAQTQPATHLMALGLASPSPAVTPVATPPPHKVPGSPPLTTTTTKQETTTTRRPPPPPVPRVLSITPRSGATNVSPMTTLTVALSSRPLPGAPMPTLEPAVAGVWSVKGATVRFTPTAGYSPWATEHLMVPASLARSTKSEFTVQGVGTLRAQELLAELKYIPLRFGTSPGQSSLDGESEVANLVSPVAQPGSFTWRYPNIPPTLSALWSRGQYGVITQGAIMTFENDMNLPVEG